MEVDFFRELASQVLTGRDFHSSDVESLPLEKRVAVIVNTSFVDNVLEGSSPLGHQALGG